MLGFEIWKNGRKIATAGLTDAGAMSFMLTWVGKDPGASSRVTESDDIEGLDLRVGGLDASDPAGEMSVEWVEDTALRLGDDLRIRIVSASETDAPLRREPTNSVVDGVRGLRFTACPNCGAPRLQGAVAAAE